MNSYVLINVIIPKNELTLKKYISKKKIHTDQAKFCEHELFFSKHELLVQPIWQHCPHLKW